MNKLVKGSVAAAAGIALLMGGAGSLALWNDQVSVNAGSVSSGTLDIAPVTGGGWDQDIDYIVPGDSLTYTKNFTVTAVGDNLDAELTSNIGSIVNSITGATFTTEFTVLNSANAPVSAVAGVYDLTEGLYTVTAKIVVVFPTTVSGQTGQTQTTDLSAVAIQINQV